MADQFVGVNKLSSMVVGIKSGTIGQGASANTRSFSARSDVGIQGDIVREIRGSPQVDGLAAAEGVAVHGVAVHGVAVSLHNTSSSSGPAVTLVNTAKGGHDNSGSVTFDSAKSGRIGGDDSSPNAPSGPNNNLLNEDPVNKVQQLLDAYLSGKLSQGELAHKLRVHNSVVADQIIKDGKKAPTSAVNYIEVTRATVENPGGVYPEPPEKTQPKKGLGGGYGPGQPDEDEGKKMREKEEKQEIQQQQRERIEVENTNERDREAKEIQHQHILAEEERRREEEEELGLGEGLDGLEALARTSFGTFSKVRQAASPNQIRRELAKKELDKQKEQALTESTGASQQDR